MNFTYNMFRSAINQLSQQIMMSGINYHYICGIVRGGLIPATALSYKNNIPMITINCSLRDYRAVDNDPTVVEIVRTHNVLVVDDIIDSGQTIKYLKDTIRDNIHVAALIYNTEQTNTTCQYYYDTIDRSVDKQWVNFWWDEVNNGQW